MKKNLMKILSVILCMAMLVSVMTIFTACGKKAPEEKKVVIIENGVSEYAWVRPDKTSKQLLDTILAFQRSITDMIGSNVVFVTDWVRSEADIDPSAKEILIGNTNRPETKEVLETLDINSWAVVDKGNKVVICANNDALLSVAIDWFIKNCVNEKEKTVKITEKLVKTEGFGEGLPISLGGVSGYQVVYPKGNEMLEYYASLIQRKAKVEIAVSDDKAATENEIVIGNTNRSDAVTFSGANEYSITTDGAKVYINASNEDVLYYAVNYYIEYGLTITDTVISAPADYSKSATLENYYDDKWDLNLPYIEDGKISQVYNTGTGMANDSEKETLIDSYMHLVYSAEYSAFENYAKKLESFGFKKMYSSKLENNDLWGYRLGAAYAYISYTPSQKHMRVIWDKSSNCEISDVDYVEEQTGTTTFYQYSIDYGESKMNYSGVNGWGLFNIIKLQDNSLILVDGGSAASWHDKSLKGLTDFLYDITETDSNEPLNIRLWYYTHSDSDHNGLAQVFLDYLKNHGYKSPEIEALAFNYPSERGNEKLGKSAISYTMIEYMNKNYPNVKYLKLHTGTVFNIGEVKFEVLGTIESIVNTKGKIPADYDTNDTCSLVRLHFGGKSFMLTGDISGSENEYIAMYSADFLKCDVYQVAHHGINMLKRLDKFSSAEYALVPNAIENNLSVRKDKLEYFTGLFGADKLHHAGSYTTAIEVTKGNMTLTKVLRYDHPTGQLDHSVK